MLRLLAQREQGYDDIAALMGLSVGEVRAKVVGALAQLEADGEPRPDVPPPFPVAGEEGAAPAKAPPEPAAKPKAEASKEPPAPKAVPAEPVASEEEPPSKVKPKAEPAPKAAPVAAASSGGSSGGGSGLTITLPSGRGLWPWIGGAAAIIAIVVIVILIAGGGGGNSSSTEAAATTPAASEEPASATSEKGSETGESATNAAASKEPTTAVLKAVGGGSATGKATFGRIKNKLALLLEAEGLETTGSTDAYTVWLAQSEAKMLPLASSPVEAKAKGKIAASFEVPTEVLSYLANGTFDQIYLTHTQNAKLKTTLSEATKKGEAPAYTGETVLNGTVTGPIVGAALREEEAQEAKEKEG